jgi:hypothetical protein
LAHGLRVGSLGELAVGKQRQTLLRQCTLLGEITGRGGRFELLQLVDGGAAQRGCPGGGSVIILGAADVLARERQPHRAVGAIEHINPILVLTCSDARKRRLASLSWLSSSQRASDLVRQPLSQRTCGVCLKSFLSDYDIANLDHGREIGVFRNVGHDFLGVWTKASLKRLD